MQLGQFPKNMITSEEIEKNLVKLNMLGGKNPFDMQNPFFFSDDKKFHNTVDGSTGSWAIIESDETW